MSWRHLPDNGYALRESLAHFYVLYRNWTWVKPNIEIWMTLTGIYWSNYNKNESYLNVIVLLKY